MNENKTEGSFREEHALGGPQLAHDAEARRPHAERKAGVWAQPSTDCSDTGCRVTSLWAELQDGSQEEPGKELQTSGFSPALRGGSAA